MSATPKTSLTKRFVERWSKRGLICDDGKHRSELEMYCAHLLGLWPGKTVPVFLVHTTEPKDVSVWEEAEQELLVAEGRRQLDEQQKQLEQVRGRAQISVHNLPRPSCCLRRRTLYGVCGRQRLVRDDLEHWSSHDSARCAGCRRHRCWKEVCGGNRCRAF